MLQNRIDPFGNIIRTPAKGAWMGNRGILHDDKKEIKHLFRLKAWITCTLEYKGNRREVMSPNTWTELFFLDEATAFSAGHRPCFFCRNQEAKNFKIHWLKGNPGYGFTDKKSIQELDNILHTERIGENKEKRTYEEEINLLPNGSFISIQGQPYLVNDTHLHLWTPFGYEQFIDKPASGRVVLITPPTIVNAFRAGYLPQMKL